MRMIALLACMAATACANPQQDAPAAAEPSLDDAGADEAPAPRITPADGSLGIGSLKGDAGHE